MKNTLFIVSFLLLSCFSGATPCVWGHTDVTPEEAKNLIDTNADLIVVDVREEKSEYCSEDLNASVPPGHIPGALNYPWSSGVLQERYAELPIDGEILIVCRSGNRSNQAAEFLDSKGYLHIYDMNEGMSAWEWETVLCVDSNTDPCPAAKVYGKNSVEAELLRYFRDNLLKSTPIGQELTKLYYAWSPVIVKVMEDDEAFKEEVQEMIDAIVPLIEAKIK